MRDKLMNEQYFAEFISEEKERINKFSTKLANGEVREDRVFAVSKKLDSLKYGVLVAEYSQGRDLNELRVDYIKLLNDMPKFWAADSSYVDMVWMMSLAIMFEVSKDEFKVLSDLVEKNNRNDALLFFFTKYMETGAIDEMKSEFSYGSPYEKLAEVVADKASAADLLKTYLEKYWYSGHKDMAWYDIHKSSEKLYSGYWSFEAGAIAKILGIDDSILRDVNYYPYDLVHYSRG